VFHQPGKSCVSYMMKKPGEELKGKKRNCLENWKGRKLLSQ
jgi:hypothetical protein